MRSLVLRAGTVAGVVAVLALPATAASAASTATTTTSVSSTATTGRIVSGEALAAAMSVPAPASAGGTAPVVHRRPLGSGTTTGYAEATS
ncbi:MAG: hypothetical protein U0R76_12975 [Candidatus Nanopelagicales bacterium]